MCGDRNRPKCFSPIVQGVPQDMIKTIKDTRHNLQKKNVDAPLYGKKVSSTVAPQSGMTCLNAYKLPKIVIIVFSIG